MRLVLLLSTVLVVFAVAVGCADGESGKSPRTIGSGETDGSTGSFAFTAAGDYGSSKDASATLDLIARSGADFNLALGDLSYTDAPESAWCEYISSKVGETFPFQLVAGNHEDD